MDYEEELEEQYNAINKYQEKIQDEKYEISKLEYILAKLENEKQQLIKYLENKIKEIKKENKTNGLINEIYFYNETKIDTFQEVLDFVKESDKDAG